MAIEYHHPDARNFGIRIIIISKNDCPQCTTLKNKLDNEGIAYLAINAEQDQIDAQEKGTDVETYEVLEGHTAYDFVTEVKGVRQMPYVLVSNPEELYEDEWHGLRPDKVSPLVRGIVKKRNEG